MVEANTGGNLQPHYEHWALFAAWTFEQATALSLDIDPGRAQSGECPPEILARYKNRLDIVNSHRYLSEYFPKSGCVEPHVFVAWATNYDLSMPEALLTAVAKVHGKDAEWRQIWKRASEIKARDKRIIELETENAELRLAVDDAIDLSVTEGREQGELSPKSRQSLLKLVLGMAMDKYHYRPNSGNSSATGRIVASLERFEIKLTQDPVLKWLRTAADETHFQVPE